MHAARRKRCAQMAQQRDACASRLHRSCRRLAPSPRADKAHEIQPNSRNQQEKTAAGGTRKFKFGGDMTTNRIFSHPAASTVAGPGPAPGPRRDSESESAFIGPSVRRACSSQLMASTGPFGNSLSTSPLRQQSLYIAPSATVYLHRPLIRLVRKVSRARPGLAAARRPGRARGHCLPSPAHHRAIRPTWRGMWPSTAGSAPPPPPSQRTEALRPIGCRHQFCMVSPRATLRAPRHDGRLRRRQMPAPCRIGCRVGGVTVVWAQQRRRSEKARRHWRNQCPAAGAGAASLFKAVQIVGPSLARRSPAL
jgi:hypothetical protein